MSFTSTSPEVWRGLGYWLSYVRDAVRRRRPRPASTTWCRAGSSSPASCSSSSASPGSSLTRWSHRRFAVAARRRRRRARGRRPPDRRPVAADGRRCVGDGTSGAALALRSAPGPCRCWCSAWPSAPARSSTRAAPLRLAAASPWRPSVAGRSSAVLAVANLPVAHRAPPRRSRRSTATRTRRRRGSRPPPRSTPATPAPACCSCPGQEFGAFRWGYTVDPPLPGLTDKPLVTRDLLPLGSAGGDGPALRPRRPLPGRHRRARRRSRPIARLLGADTIWLTDDAAFDRFRTPRPELVARPVRRRRRRALGAPTPYGEPVVNRPDIPMVDEQSVSDPRVGTPVAAGRARRRRRPGPGRAGQGPTSCSSPGSGDGLVDAAAAGLLDGTELVRYTAARRGARDVAAGADDVIVTDSNRDRAHHWRGSQDVVGFTEDDDPASPTCCAPTPADERLPVFGRRRRGADRRRAGRTGAGPRHGVRRAVRLPPRAPRRDGGRRRPDDGVGRRRPGRPDRRAARARRRRADRPRDAAAAARAPAPCATSAQVDASPSTTGRRCAVDLDERVVRRRRPARRHRADDRAEHGRRSRSTASSCPTRRSARRSPPSASPRSTPASRRRSRSCARRPTSSTAIAAGGRHPGVVRAHPAAHPADRPLARPTPNRRWCARSSCPTTARSTSPSRSDSTSGPPTTCSPTLLGIDGPLAPIAG